MKRGPSTGKPTKAEAARIVAAKEGPCIACLLLVEQGRIPDWKAHVGCDYHHLLSGGRRRGHRFGIALCGHHHRRIPDFGCSHAEMRETYGPSLMDGSRLFRDAFGDDETLLAKQDALLGIDTQDEAA